VGERHFRNFRYRLAKVRRIGPKAQKSENAKSKKTGHRVIPLLTRHSRKQTNYRLASCGWEELQESNLAVAHLEDETA
jgi:hypothetical protein